MSELPDCLPHRRCIVGGFTPDDCLDMENMFPEANKMETLLQGRRAVRRYQDQNIESSVMERLLQVSWQVTTGVNARVVLFTVVDNKETMDRLRIAVMNRVAELVHYDNLPEQLKFFAGFVKLWEEKKRHPVPWSATYNHYVRTQKLSLPGTRLHNSTILF